MLKIYERYGPQANPGDANYPNGSFKNHTGVVRGTPLEKDWANSFLGATENAMYEAGLDSSGDPDTAQECQYHRALDVRYGRNTYNPALPIQDIFAEKYWDTNNWSKPDAFPNYLYDAGATFRDACMGMDYDTYRPCLYVVKSTNTIHKVTGSWVYDSAPTLGSALTLDFGATPESIRSVCTDGTKLYVLWRASDNTYRVSSFSMQTFIRYLNISLGVDYTYEAEYSKIILANDDYLAVSIDYVGGKSGVAIINKDSGTFSTGNGGTGGTTSTAPFPGCGRMTTDGTHVFWIHTEDSSPYSSYLCSAKISAPTTSDYTATSLSSSSTSISEIPTALYNYGGSDGTVVTATAGGFFWIYSKSLDASRAALEIHNNTPMTGSTEFRTIMGCDGTNFWIHLQQDNDADSDSRLAWSSVPMAICCESNAVASSVDRQLYEGEFVMTDKAGTAIVDNEVGRLLYDGLDMWQVTRNGMIFRIVNPSARK